MLTTHDDLMIGDAIRQGLSIAKETLRLLADDLEIPALTAKLVANYRNALVAEGFSPDEATALAGQMVAAAGKQK